MYVQKNGLKNITHISSCLCLDNKQKIHFFQKNDMPSFANYIKRFNLNSFARSLILFYQASFSYFLGGNCRYYPSCSNYAHEAFLNHKLFFATFLVFKRLLSCQPFSKKSFFDPVPLNTIEKSQLI